MSTTCYESIKWHVSQLKGSLGGDALEGDNFTCVEYNDTGELLAVGDKGGRVTVFKETKESEQDSTSYDVYCAFTSHEPEFDYLKSLEIEEKINSITWLPKLTAAHHLLSANDKTIKLWRLSERTQVAYNFNIRDDDGERPWSSTVEPADPDDSDTPGPQIPRITSTAQLRIPRFRKNSHLTVEARPRRVFANAHTYHINAISLNSDQETFLSSDDLRINLWHLDVCDQSFTIVDLKPPNMEDLSEVITCARFHPDECHLLAYSTSRGVIRLCDMRARALCDNHVLVFEDPRLTQNLGFFADIIASLSDFRFGHSGHHILARDYLTLKVWDIRMGDRPCEVYSVHEPFRSQLCMLYENDAIFDKFLCSWSSDDRFLLTGSYGNLFRIFDRANGSDWLYDLNDCSPFVHEDESINTPIRHLPPKRYLSPEDPLGSCLGLTTVCVASVQSIDTFLLHSDSSQSSSTSSSSSSPSSYSDGANGADEDDDGQSSVMCDRPREPQLLVPTHGGDEADTSSSDLSSPQTGSKRRKQVLASAVRADELGDAENERPSTGLRRRRRRKRRLGRKSKEPTVTSSTAAPSILNDVNRAFDLENGLDNSSTSSLFTEQRIRKKLARRQLFPDDYPSNGSSSIADLQQLDCQRKLLHLAWHPRDLKLATISGNQMFLLKGTKNPVVPTPFAQPGLHVDLPPGEERENASEADAEDADGDLSSDFESAGEPEEACTTVTDPGIHLDAKAPKRPRRRSNHNTDASALTSALKCRNIVEPSPLIPADVAFGNDKMLLNGNMSEPKVIPPTTAPAIADDNVVDPAVHISADPNSPCDLPVQDDMLTG